MLLLERDPLVSELSQERAALGLLGPRRATLKLWVAVVALVHFDRGAATVAAMDVSIGAMLTLTVHPSDTLWSYSPGTPLDWQSATAWPAPSSNKHRQKQCCSWV